MVAKLVLVVVWGAAIVALGLSRAMTRAPGRPGLPPPAFSQAARATTAEQLSFDIRDRLLRQMSSPAQGEDCLGSKCAITATLFSGPAVNSGAVVLQMSYAAYEQWYFIVAPTTSDALLKLQNIVKRTSTLPYASGVAVVYKSTTEYWWLAHGHLHRLTSRHAP